MKESPSYSTLNARYMQTLTLILAEATDGKPPNEYLNIIENAAEVLADYFTELQRLEQKPPTSFIPECLTKATKSQAVIPAILARTCHILAQRNHYRNEEETKVDHSALGTKEQIKRII